MELRLHHWRVRLGFSEISHFLAAVAASTARAYKLEASGPSRRRKIGLRVWGFGVWGFGVWGF